jgi:hypothetical protein
MGLFDLKLILYSVLYTISMLELYPLRNISFVESHFKFGKLVAFATVIQQLQSNFGWVIIVVLIIRKFRWYTPFTNYIIALIISVVVIKLLDMLNLTTPGNQKPKMEVFIFSLLSLLSFILFLRYCI